MQYLPKDVLKEIEFEFGDIMNYESIDKATNNADIIYNLAALVSVPYSYKNSESFFDVNIKGLLNLLNSVNKKVPLRELYKCLQVKYMVLLNILL